MIKGQDLLDIYKSPPRLEVFENMFSAIIDGKSTSRSKINQEYEVFR